MNLDLTGRNALVGGSSKGIGRAVAEKLAALGATVTLVARSAETLAEVAQQLDRSHGQHHDFLVADFSDSRDLKRKVELLVAQKPIHILVNNTGGPPGGPIVEARPEEFERAFHNHLICNHLLAQTVLSGMKAAGYGRIVNIISTSVKEPIPGLGVSNTTRGAVASWAKTLAGEVAPFGITVNNVLPGATKTERLFSIIEARAAKSGKGVEAETEAWMSSIPMRRFAEPAEIAAAVAFLASPAASYITGVSLAVDGGRTRAL